jgi:hypothetical protein
MPARVARGGPRGLAVLLLLAARVEPLTAQHGVAPRPVRPAATVLLHAPHLAVLRRAVRDGDDERLVASAADLLDDLQRSGFSPECCDYDRHYFLVVFTAPSAVGTTGIVPVLVHHPMSDVPALPGVHGDRGPQLYEIFLSDADTADTLTASYAVTPEASPAAKQLDDFVATVIGRLALPIGTRPGVERAAQRTPPSVPARIRLGRIALPGFGSLGVRYTVTYAELFSHLRALAAAARAEAADLADAMSDGDVEGASCLALADELRAVFERTLRSAACGSWIGDPAACGKKLREETGRAAGEYLASGAGCPGAQAAPVIQRFVEAAADVKPLTATSTLENRGRTRYGFGLVTGFIARFRLDSARPRTTIESNRIVVDPFDRLLAMGIVTLTPWGSAPKAGRLSAVDRAHLFAGPVFAPNFGAAVGFGFLISRTVAVDTGYARLWFDTPKPGEALGQPPSDKSAPFELASAGAWFIGVSYHLK